MFQRVDGYIAIQIAIHVAGLLEFKHHFPAAFLNKS
jgi:hypothetical protein